MHIVHQECDLSDEKTKTRLKVVWTRLRVSCSRFHQEGHIIIVARKYSKTVNYACWYLSDCYSCIEVKTLKQSCVVHDALTQYKSVQSDRDIILLHGQDVIFRPHFFFQDLVVDRVQTPTVKEEWYFNTRDVSISDDTGTDRQKKLIQMALQWQIVLEHLSSIGAFQEALPWRSFLGKSNFKSEG